MSGQVKIQGKSKSARSVKPRIGTSEENGKKSSRISIDLTGKKFGRWTVIEIAERQNGYIYYKCQCECGTIKNIFNGHLNRGASKSCGCLLRDVLVKRNLTHGKTNTKEFKIWQGMLKRCNNKNSQGYVNYGGRGISVCERWLKFENFLEDMGEVPKNLTIERENNNLGYCKENCKWATKTEQARNRRPQKRKKIKEVGIYQVRNKYRAIITIKTGDVHLGYFNSLSAAKAARQKAEGKYWFENY